MSLFDNPEYRWRETYLLFHKKTHRASVDKIRHAISGIRGHYQIEQLVANAHFDLWTWQIAGPHMQPTCGGRILGRHKLSVLDQVHRPA